MPPPPTPPTPRFAFRIITREELAAFEETGVYPGSALDARDNSMHLSPLEVVGDTANLYFAGHAALSVLQVELALIPGAVIRQDWVESRGVFFPHVISGDLGFAIPRSAVVKIHAMERGADGAFAPLAL